MGIHRIIRQTPDVNKLAENGQYWRQTSMIRKIFYLKLMALASISIGLGMFLKNEQRTTSWLEIRTRAVAERANILAIISQKRQ